LPSDINKTFFSASSVGIKSIFETPMIKDTIATIDQSRGTCNIQRVVKDRLIKKEIKMKTTISAVKYVK
jgi:hypothetical protein